MRQESGEGRAENGKWKVESGDNDYEEDGFQNGATRELRVESGK
jgi:hypothetical protein